MTIRYVAAALAVTIAGTLSATSVADAHVSPRRSCLTELHRATDVPRQLTNAWAANDAVRVSSAFARSGDLVNTRGEHSAGRRAIRQYFEAAFDDQLKGTRPELTVARARCVSEDVAIVHVNGGLVLPGQTEPHPDTNQIQTWTLERAGHRWLIASLQTTLVNPGGPHPGGSGAETVRQPSATVARTGRSCRADLDLIRDVPARLTREGWAPGDAVAFASLFTPNGDLIVGDGVFLTGRVEIEDYLTTVFEAVPGVTADATVIGVECIDRAVAVLHTTGGLLLPGETEVPPERRGIQSWVVTGFDGEWLIAAYQNTRVAQD